MNEIIRLVVMEERRTRTASIYISILIAYLEMNQWDEAQHILDLLSQLPLLSLEQQAVAYLSTLHHFRYLGSITSLIDYLSKG